MSAVKVLPPGCPRHGNAPSRGGEVHAVTSVEAT